MITTKFPHSGLCTCVQLLRHVKILETQWTVAHQVPLSMGFPRQEYQCGLPFPSLGDLPNPGIKATPPALASRFFTTDPPGKLHYSIMVPFLDTQAFMQMTFKLLPEILTKKKGFPSCPSTYNYFIRQDFLLLFLIHSDSLFYIYIYIYTHIPQSSLFH